VALRGDVVALCQFARLSRLWADIGTFSPHHAPDPATRDLRDLRAALGGQLVHRVGERNAVQRALYIEVITVIVLTVLSGLAIWKPVQFQELTAVFGGYDAARYVHFFCMAAIVLFLAVHLALTALVPKVLPPMITGRDGRRR
jgi:thiosulfate reductase cytochrome b subunit